MLKVFERLAPLPIKAVLEGGVYELTMPFHGEPSKE
jgi:hypothetical protein